MVNNILYIHGMGGGGDSRIPSILRDALRSEADVIVKTYDFDPEIAAAQISSWVSELKPELVIGESLGCLHTLKISGIPHLFVSPALNASFYFSIFSVLTRIPGMTKVFDRIYRPREGDRQPLHFIPDTLKKYRRHREEALTASAVDGGSMSDFAFSVPVTIIAEAVWSAYVPGASISAKGLMRYMKEPILWKRNSSIKC